MNAIVYPEGGGEISSLHLEKQDIPTPHGRDVLVRLRGSSINPVDTKIRQGKFPASTTTGFDGCGIIESVGENVNQFQSGDEVFFAGHLGRPGSMAEYTIIDSRLIALKPRTLSFSKSAAFPLVSITAWEMLVDHFNMVPYATIDSMANKKNEASILIINGAGGVGSIATQLASKVLRLQNVVVSASRAETIDHAKKMGATHTVDHKGDIKAQIKELGIEEFKYIMICHDTKSYLALATELASPLGKIGSIVETSEPLDFHSMDAFSKSLSFHWEFMFAKPTTGRMMESQGRILKQIAKLIDAGIIADIVSQSEVLSVASLKAAHEKIESGGAIGKIVFDVPDHIE